MSLRFLLPLTLALLASLTASAAAAPVPQKFGDDHDDPRTANPTVPRPATRACTIQIVDHGFDSFEPARGRVDAPAACPGPWQRVVLEMDGEVAGRQYDRMGYLAIGGATVFRTSSPEPSREGIRWHVEKDLTEYAPLLSQPQPLEMHLGNVVNETYTGIFKIKARLVFYPADRAHPAAATADVVAALADVREVGTETVGQLSIPANAERLLLEVYATGSGGGCEEFWYDAAPPDPSIGEFWCKAPQGPYREVQVLVDGRVAGIAAPYPHIYTGGWSNPHLWYVIPAPRAFDIRPLRFELTPFVGELNDGKAHEVRLRVAGVPEGGKGWALNPVMHVWRDAGTRATKGKLLEATLAAPSLDNKLQGDKLQDGVGRHHLRTRAQSRFVARGVLQTSHGSVETAVERGLDSELDHHWSDDDAHDGLRANWGDREVVTRRTDAGPLRAETRDARFGIEGAIDTVKVDGKPRLTTTLTLNDDSELRQSEDERVTAWEETRDRFDGAASYTGEVPRAERNATGNSRQEFLQRDSSGKCERRVLRTRNGRFVEDVRGCGSATAPARQKT
ncbi:MAG TPA: peptide-N4-asparagine amidase [Lysobacter sp.]